MMLNQDVFTKLEQDLTRKCIRRRFCGHAIESSYIVWCHELYQQNGILPKEDEWHKLSQNAKAAYEEKLSNMRGNFRPAACPRCNPVSNPRCNNILKKESKESKESKEAKEMLEKKRSKRRRNRGKSQK